MLNGHAEGIVINQQKQSVYNDQVFTTTSMTKWKIGSEPNEVNIKFLNEMIKTIETDDGKECEEWEWNGKKIFGENLEKAKDMFHKMLNICHS